MRKTLSERFWGKVEKKGAEECWEWLANTRREGQGRMFVNGEVKMASHVSWFLHRGEWPTVPLTSTCRNARCVNVAHLIEGGVGPRKYREEQVVEARRLFNEGVPRRKVAEILAIPRGSISRFIYSPWEWKGLAVEAIRRRGGDGSRSL